MPASNLLIPKLSWGRQGGWWDHGGTRAGYAQRVIRNVTAERVELGFGTAHARLYAGFRRIVVGRAYRLRGPPATAALLVWDNLAQLSAIAFR